MQHLRGLWGGALPAGARALASHPRIAQTARAAGFTEVQTCAPDLAAVVQALQSMQGPGGASIQSPLP